MLLIVLGLFFHPIDDLSVFVFDMLPDQGLPILGSRVNRAGCIRCRLYITLVNQVRLKSKCNRHVFYRHRSLFWNYLTLAQMNYEKID